ncbi:MAG TPA: hypothetical protein PLO37_02395 [Candidatus Hydrogenedentes bacterium]|nr:hypothetical protein [Candidatus Hydrogenedentota bacterium]HPG65668.1 hypothetical protein [Candidatus Hydrogenedentota bacterium]
MVGPKSFPPHRPRKLDSPVPDRVGHSVVFVVAVAVQSAIRATTNTTNTTPAGTLA